jgi:hypothetical protein
LYLFTSISARYALRASLVSTVPGEQATCQILAGVPESPG